MTKSSSKQPSNPWKSAKLISAGALVLALVHLLFPKLSVDSTTAILVLIAILPWLAPLIKSIEIPGVGKLEYRDFQNIINRAESEGLLVSETEAVKPDNIDEPLFALIASDDLNLALAGLRIEIERRLIEMAKVCGMGYKRQGIIRLVHRLHEKGAISNNERFIISEMVELLNQAVHGARVNKDAADVVIEIGPKLLAALDKRVDAARQKN